MTRKSIMKSFICNIQFMKIKLSATSITAQTTQPAILPYNKCHKFSNPPQLSYTHMQTLTKLPSHLAELHLLLTSSSNKPSTYLQLFSQHPQQAKLLINFVDQHIQEDFVCYFNSKICQSPNFASCQLFCQDYSQMSERQQQADKQKSRNLASILIFTLVKILWISILYTNIAHYFLPQLSTSHPTCPLLPWLLTGQHLPQTLTLASIKSLLWEVSMIVYALGGIALSIGLIFHSAKSLIISWREIEEIEREKIRLINGDVQ